MMSSICSETSGPAGSASLSSSIGDDAALLGAGDHLLDRRVVEVDQRRIARLGRLDFLCFVFRHIVPPLNRCRQADASLCLNPCCACDQALLFLEGLVGQIPLQPFGCIVQGLFHFLRRSDDLDRCGQIASGAVRVAVAAGEGKAHGARGRSPPAAPSVPNMVDERRRDQASAPEKAALTSSSRSCAVPRVGDRQRGELLAMGGQLLGEIGEAEDQRAGGRRVDAAGGDGARLVADGRLGRREAAVLERCRGAAAEAARLDARRGRRCSSKRLSQSSR